MFRSIVDLFIAGTDTTARSIHWILLYLLRFQDAQEKCHAEINQVSMLIAYFDVQVIH